MATVKERVTYVRFVFSANDNLFASRGDLSLYDIPKSVAKYIRLCEDKIRQTYPNIGDNIDVINSDDDISAGETNVEVSDDLEGNLGLVEQKVVTEICERIFEQLNWYVWKTFVLISEAKFNVKLPASIIRWICAKGLINANKSTSLWRILPEDLDGIDRHVEFVMNEFQLTNLARTGVSTACYLEDMQKVSIATLPKNVNLLVASRDGFDDELFASDSSLFSLQIIGNRLNILAEHFVNIVEWSLWDCVYHKAANTLQAQANKKGIDCELQLPDAISFSQSIQVTQNLTVQQCIQTSLQSLSKVIDNAKISLKGGIVWDEIYEQKGQELLFQKEVLHPLLQNMDYQLVFPTHGNRGEHGRDFVFYERTKFGNPLYYALQAKAGNVSGGANRDIDELVIQIDRALLMPVKPPSEKAEAYVSVIIIAISGKFTKDAEEVIRKKIPKYITEGAVYFWDKDKIQSLIAQYPNKEE
ncbi:MAG: hypothetical protein KDI79_20485 [Anaerolineae bacterium]|nr:hypothetical protein [Anaerolineae bacterium]